MNERQHIALTEAQIIAAEKGEIQLEYRNGERVCQVIWLKTPYTQTYNPVMSMTVYGNIFNHSLSGKCSNNSSNDLFVSEQVVDFSEPSEQASPKPLYEVGEIIELSIDGVWRDSEYVGFKNDFVFSLFNGSPHAAASIYHRKKKTEKTVTLENKVMTVKEAFKFLTNL